MVTQQSQLTVITAYNVRACDLDGSADSCGFQIEALDDKESSRADAIDAKLSQRGVENTSKSAGIAHRSPAPLLDDAIR